MSVDTASGRKLDVYRDLVGAAEKDCVPNALGFPA